MTVFDIQTKIELKKGNPKAFKEVFNVLYPRLKGYCKLFISDVSQVEDIIQESVISFWDNKHFIKTDKTIETSTNLKIDKQLKFVSNHL